MIKLFNLDLHISVIADVKDVLTRLYGTKVQIDNWTLSGHSWVFNKEPDYVSVVNQHTWIHLNKQMVQEFVNTYREKLESYDGFIVTHTPVFCRLYETFGKPIIMVNSCRYDQPYCLTNLTNIEELQELNLCLRRLSSKGLLIPISNNIGDKNYFELGTGIRSFHIPSLCMYTDIVHNPEYASHRKPMISCGNGNCIPSFIDADERPSKYEWSDIMQRKALICIPYEVSTMSLFEHYSSGVPIFMPSKDFLKDLILSKKIEFGSFNTKKYWQGLIPKNILETTNLDWWLERCDYYDKENMPYIHLFNSWEDLKEQLENFSLTVDFYTLKKVHLEQREKWILGEWKKIMEHTFESLRE